MAPDEKLESYLDLADQVTMLARRLAESAQQVTTGALRTRVMAGLVLKAYSAFEGVIRDASARSDCAMHHLKTMVEVFIYFNWILVDKGDARARLVFADSIERKIRFGRDNPDRVDSSSLNQLRLLQQAITTGIEAEWREYRKKTRGQIRRLADQAASGVPKWYRGIYQMACDPAHIGDLIEYVPLPGKPLPFPQGFNADLSACIALDYALHLMRWLLRSVSAYLAVNIEHEITDMDALHDRVRAG